MPRKRTKKARRDTTTAYTNKVGETGGRTTRKGHTARMSYFAPFSADIERIPDLRTALERSRDGR